MSEKSWKLPCNSIVEITTDPDDCDYPFEIQIFPPKGIIMAPAAWPTILKDRWGFNLLKDRQTLRQLKRMITWMEKQL